MSESFFDDLARTLATPMPRRRALRLSVGAFVAVALPGALARPVRAALTSAAAKCPPGGQLTCAQQFGPKVSECCGPIRRGHPEDNHTCCPPGECYRDPVTGFNANCCKPANQCGRGRCCRDEQRCVEGECRNCPPDKICGKTCCEKKQTCVGGKCTCPDGRPACGRQCCPKGKVCSKAVAARTGKASYVCCTRGKFNCGDGKCCNPNRCCDGKCCSDEAVCASAVGGKKGKVCCPKARVAKRSGGRACCPIGTVSDGFACCPAEVPNCCGEDLAPLCLKGQICVRGVCQRVG